MEQASSSYFGKTSFLVSEGADSQCRQLSADQKDYSEYFSACQFVHHGAYLKIGEMADRRSWMIYLSVVRQQADHFFREILPVLLNEDLSFLIPKDSVIHSAINDGTFGLTQIGKIVTIALDDPQDNLELIRRLIGISQKYAGVEVPAAIRLGDNVSTYFDHPDKTDVTSEGLTYTEIHEKFSPEALANVLKISGIKWPYETAIIAKKHRASKLIRRRYIRISDLRDDAKGRISKCVKLNGLYNAQWCVLKYGRKNQCFDDYGRESADRFLWQEVLAKRIGQKINTPKLIDHFVHKGEHYLAYEFIEGKPLITKVHELTGGNSWYALHQQIRAEIFGYLKQVLLIINALHQLKIVHRDISAGNFLINESGKIYIIDFEVSFDLISKEPSPPFELGTPGYISPQQYDKTFPAFSDDIYSFGALVAKLLTGLSPVKLNVGEPELFYSDLLFFTGSSAIASMICKCMHHDPANRPEIAEIINFLDLQLAINTTTGSIRHDKPNDTEELIALTIVKAMNSTLTSTSFFEKAGERTDEIALNMLMHDAEKKDLSDRLVTAYHRVCVYAAKKHQDEYQSGFLEVYQSLQVQSAGLLEITPENLLGASVSGVNLTDGLAGKGLCLLQYLVNNNDPVTEEMLRNIVAELLSLQQKDGSWIQSKAAFGSDQVKITGFLYGVSGIVFFLLEYHQHYTADKKVATAIQKALDWLIAQGRSDKGKLTWYINNSSGVADPWFGNGMAGIAFIFIRAYEVFSNPVYRQVASDSLSIHPETIQSNYLSVESGVAGLGQVCLEAWRVFKEPLWYQRASHIANFICHSASRTQNEIYWLDGNDLSPRSGFLTGNEGIIHFLLRYLKPESLQFPYSI